MLQQIRRPEIPAHKCAAIQVQEITITHRREIQEYARNLAVRLPVIILRQAAAEADHPVVVPVAYAVAVAAVDAVKQYKIFSLEGRIIDVAFFIA
jgi:hypothetical protein